MTKSAKLQAAIEIISALAVVITLIFLLIEIRQNTEQTRLNAKAVEITAYQDLISQILEMNKMGFQDPEFLILEAKHNAGVELTLEESERLTVQLESVSWMRFRHGDMAYHQFENGIIDEDRLLSSFGILGLELEETWEAWEFRRANFTKNYRDYMDKLIAEEKLKAAKAQQAKDN